MNRLYSLILLTGCIIAFTTTGAAITTYNIQVHDDTAYINASFELYSSGPNKKINYWETTWSMPPHSEILGMHDTQGPITDYTVTDNTVRFKTNKGPRRTKEVVDVQLVAHQVVKNTFNGVNLVRLQLAGFNDLRKDVPDEVTQATVHTDQRLLAESHSYGFDYSLTNHSATYRGAGPLNIYLSVGDGGKTYQHYVLYGDANLTEGDKLYWLVPALTGFVPTENKYPVIVLPDAEYDKTVDTWSAGQYRTGGLIFLRKSTTEKPELPAILLHETTHAFNEHVLRWTNNGLPWFDEGTAKYVEYLVKNKKHIRQAQIFGDKTTWTGPCTDQAGQCRYTLPSRGTADELWNYYTQGSNGMYTWSPETATTTAQRTFGYAYAELFFRNLVQQHGGGTLRDVYTAIQTFPQDKTATRKQETERVLNRIGEDFTPCYNDSAPSKSRFESCLTAVNRMNPPVPTSVTVQNTTRTIHIEPIQRPNASSSVFDRITATATGNGHESLMNLLLDTLYVIGTWFEQLFNNLFKIV